MNFQNHVAKFMTTSGQTTTEYNSGQMALYFSLQLEELAEKLEVLGINRFAETVRNESMKMRSGHYKEFYDNMSMDSMVDMLDADIDLAWVSIGAAYSMGADVTDAIEEVARSNHDKFRDGVVKDASGKVVKPSDWSAPDLYTSLFGDA